MPANNFNFKEFLDRCRLVVETDNGKFEEVKNLNDIKPGRSYYLDPQSNVPGAMVTLGDGSDDMPRRYFRALRGTNTLTSSEIRELSGLNKDIEGFR